MCKCCICGKRHDEIEVMTYGITECDCGGGIIQEDENFDWDFD